MSRIKPVNFPLSGGLNLVSPSMTKGNGELLFCKNYEPNINGGYRSVSGYERFDGQARPSKTTISSSILDNAELINNGILSIDTTEDDDNGEWIDNAVTQSWYHEELNTDTRGATKAFPETALIVVDSDTVTIYDTTYAPFPMWMVFDITEGEEMIRNAGGNITGIVFKNGILYCSVDSAAGQLIAINFINDSAEYYTADRHSAWAHKGILDRNISSGWSDTDISINRIVSADINDIAVTSDGNGNNTVAVATGGGVSVIHADGSVADSADTGDAHHIGFNDARLVWGRATNPNIFIAATYIADGFGEILYSTSTIPALFGGSKRAILPNITQGGTLGLIRLKEDTGTPENGMVCYQTADYISGYMHGDIKGAWLASTDDTDLVGSVGDLDADRSVNNNDLLVYGNITKTPVATDAELVAYSGFGPDDYFEQTYNSDLDFGTGDFYVMGWFRILSGYNSTAYMMRRDRPALNGSGRIILRQSGTSIQFQITANAATSLPGIYNDGEFHFAVGMRVGTDVSLYIDGVEVATATDSSVIGGGGADHILALGAQPNGNGGGWTDSLALWRIGAGAPTDEQMAEIYEEEKALFNENARCTLQGSSSDVLALDQHKTDNILAVYSTDHITKFNGLLVVSDEAIDNTPHDIETYNFLDDTDKAIFDIQREANRAAISEVPGSGSILGVCVFDNTVYAFRNNAGGTAAVMYKATVSGWTVVATPTLAIDGQYEFDTYNFGSSIMLYGCDGKNKAFQFNGTTLTQLSTGQSTDTPNHIKGHKNHLFLSFPGGHLVHSAITDPTDYTAINGAAEYNVKGEITSLAHLIGDLLVVFCKNQIIPIYGTSAADFEMKIHSESAGAFARSVATDATPIFFGEQGITVLSGTQEYGNFQTATLTQKIKPFLKDFADDSYVAGAVLDFDNSLYRLYFTDGKVLNLQFNGRAGGDSLLADYELDINCIANGRLDEEEVIFAGGTDGYVYQMETGYSNDGEEIESFIKTSFAHFGMPQQKKRFFKVLMEIDSPSPVVFSFATDYDYGTDYYPTSREKSDTVNSGGGTWDVHNWDEFLWSSQIVDELEVHLDGTGKNISMVISTLTKNTRPYVIQSITYHFAVRGIIK